MWAKAKKAIWKINSPIEPAQSPAAEASNASGINHPPRLKLSVAASVAKSVGIAKKRRHINHSQSHLLTKKYATARSRYTPRSMIFARLFIAVLSLYLLVNDLDKPLWCAAWTARLGIHKTKRHATRVD